MPTKIEISIFIVISTIAHLLSLRFLNLKCSWTTTVSIENVVPVTFYFACFFAFFYRGME